ncbi:MAG: hypothetical protein QOG10_6620 [Kribbellaceae bacterium]|jgi:hypothetical protein|nr:hypothetical protein [Kribbellaceae bacterium]
MCEPVEVLEGFAQMLGPGGFGLTRFAGYLNSIAAAGGQTACPCRVRPPGRQVRRLRLSGFDVARAPAHRRRPGKVDDRADW